MRTTRRDVLGGLGAGSALLASASVTQALPETIDPSRIDKSADIACLYHCDFGDPARFSQMLQNMLNHLSVYEFDFSRLKLVLVAHGAGVKFFLENLEGTPWARESIDPELYRRFAGLARYGVEAYLCRITYQRLQIEIARTRNDPFLKFVPSGVAAVGELQGRGFAYLKVG